jgi:hypothetical protein
MRNLLLSGGVIAAILFGGADLAGAQPPEEVIATDTVRLYVGQTRTFKFDEAVAEFTLVAKGIAQVMPLTDHTFAIQGMEPGVVLAMASAKDGHIVQRMNIAVAPIPLVRIYGTREGHRAGMGGYTSYHCTGTGCDRSDPDIVRGPDKLTITETRRDQDGNSTAVEKQYGH